MTLDFPNNDIYIYYYGHFDGIKKPDFLFKIIKDYDYNTFLVETVAGLSDTYYDEKNEIGYWPGRIFTVSKLKAYKLEPIDIVSYKLIGPSYFKEKAC